LSSESEISVSVDVPKKLYDKISNKIKNTSFPSVSTYITHLVEKELAEEGESEEQVFSKEDEEKIKDRLRKLGYI
jgi:Arc/MetJ-type ribon-helix-helix transcriptional regulator